MANGERRRSLRAQITGAAPRAGAGAAAASPAAAGSAERPLLQRALGSAAELFAPQLELARAGTTVFRDASDPGASETFVSELQRQLLGNVLNLPASTLELARTGAVAGTSPLAGLPLPPEDVDLRVDPDRVIAGVRTAVRLATEGMGEEGLGGLFGRELEGVQQARAARREAHPVAAVAGGIGGDVASLLIGRAPVDRLRRSLPALRAAEEAASPGLSRAAGRVLNSPRTQKVLRGLGRAGESSLEGAALAVLNNGDPLETAALSGGMQVGGSLSLEALRHIRKKPGLAGAVFGGAALLQVLRESTPGGRDFILESIEDSAEKAAGMIGLGIVSGVLGAGRIRGGKFAEDFPKLAEAITTLPRGTMQSIFTDLLREEEAGHDETQVAIETLSRDHDFFGEEASNRIARALRDPKRKASAEVNRLMRSRSFRDRLETARSRLQDAGTESPAAEEERAADGAEAGGASGERQRQSLRNRILSRTESGER